MDMPSRDQLIDTRDLSAALTFLTRWPVPADPDFAAARGAASAWAWPLAGAAAALVAGLFAWVLGMIGVHGGMTAVIAILLMAIQTGALHEDGLADTADGLGPMASQEKRFEIMADSRIGAFGAAALALAFLARYAGYADFGGLGLIAVLISAAALSRAVMAAAMLALQPAKATGLSASAGQPTPRAVVTSAAIAFVLALILTGWAAFPLALFAVIFAIPVMALASDRLGGQTGDILGAVQICSEIGVLVAATAFLA